MTASYEVTICDARERDREAVWRLDEVPETTTAREIAAHFLGFAMAFLRDRIPAPMVASVLRVEPQAGACNPTGKELK